MTGAYLRVQRNGYWHNLEVEYLTDDERYELLKDDPRLMNWLHLCCHKLVEAEQVLDDLVKDGLLERQ